jgi:hypothetical protein
MKNKQELGRRAEVEKVKICASRRDFFEKFIDEYLRNTLPFYEDLIIALNKGRFMMKSSLYEDAST